jgi:hypothetical protein
MFLSIRFFMQRIEQRLMIFEPNNPNRYHIHKGLFNFKECSKRHPIVEHHLDINTGIYHRDEILVYTNKWNNRKPRNKSDKPHFITWQDKFNVDIKELAKKENPSEGQEMLENYLLDQAMDGQVMRFSFKEAIAPVYAFTLMDCAYLYSRGFKTVRFARISEAIKAIPLLVGLERR